MKRIALPFTLTVALVLSGCGRAQEQGATVPEVSVPPTQSAPTDSPESSEPAVSEDIPAAYTELIGQYAAAIGERLSGGALMEKGMCYVMADCYGSHPVAGIGYAVEDLDSDGTMELVIGATSAITDNFYQKMMFDLYTLDAEGACIQVFSSTERNRYYYAGQNLFANIGSSGSKDSFETTVKLEDGEMMDTTHTTAPADYVQMELTPMECESGISLPILDEIEQNVTVGAADLNTTAVQAAVKLLDWGVNTGLDPEEIRAAAVVWLNGKGNDEKTTFAKQMAAVDEVYQKLLGDNAGELLTSAGCENTAYPWSDQPVESIEAIMIAVGLR